MWLQLIVRTLLIGLVVVVTSAVASAQPGSQPTDDSATSTGSPATSASSASEGGSDQLATDAVDMRDILAAQEIAVANGSASDAGATITGTARGGAYHDSDSTTVWRALGVLGAAWGHWSLGGTVDVDAVTSASVDVRSSPALSKVDVMTSASGRSST